MMESYQIGKEQQGIDNTVFTARIIWRDIITWLRQYLIVKTINADVELQQETTNALLLRAENFGDMIRTFFGDKAAEVYLELFSEYIKLLISLIDALAEGNSSKADEIVKQVYQNDGQRIEFLAGLNPYWEKNTLENYIYTFTNMLVQEMLAFTSKEYKNSISIHNRILSYSTSLSDFIAQGINDYFTYSIRPSTGLLSDE
ncbi:hypothetical protein Ami103574_04360 [Aminipila butyrica]|uniref:Uncharacterized protein n=1 Tax=Aminipila butyrica TaxID=433296 RepID=A0A858BUI3_9FIRM|nr:hypothetical protein [Aminipila butyrica]QIB68600.1 hypothetical protein Ami103574_04360 [Aminipila butyrica]